jgi:ADP-ribose pyrophosphatase YjhB (NUDIX family)
MGKKGSHCSYCGSLFAEEQPWPRKCAGCSSTTFQNPLPVAVVLQPVDDGLLMVRRSIEPHQGKLALPGGFIGLGESWQEAGARELEEETGLRVDARQIQDFRVLSAPDGTVLVFGLARALTAAEIPEFVANSEVSETVVLRAPEPLAFPLHTQVANEYFERQAQAQARDEMRLNLLA